MLANEITERIKTLDVVPETFVIRTGRAEASATRAAMVMLPLTGYEQGLDQSAAKFYRGGQQIVVRSPDPEEAYRVSVALQDALNIEGGAVKHIRWTVSLMRAESLPLLFPLNDGDLYETSMRFDVAAYLSN